MVIDDLSYLYVIDIYPTQKIQGGLFANVEVDAYASRNFGAAYADANAVGQFTTVDANTQANLYQGEFSGNSSAFAQGNSYASDGQNHYWERKTEFQSYWW
jgi:hypothetical protein